MPHLILEYSANVIEKSQLNTLLKSIHPVLVEMLPADLGACKSRAIECAHFCVSNGNVNNAFVHVTLKIMSGRTEDTLKKVGEKIMAMLKAYFSESMGKLQLRISIEISELSKIYFKE